MITVIRGRMTIVAAVGALTISAVTTAFGQQSEQVEHGGHIDITDAIFSETSPDCASYADRFVSDVTDMQQLVDFQGNVIIRADDLACTLRSNGIPNHDMGETESPSEGFFATPVAEIPWSFVIDRTPEQAETPTALSQGIYDAVLLNGVVVDILSAGCYDPTAPNANELGNVLSGCDETVPWLLDPMSSYSPFREDIHNAHTQPDGRYHYHGNPMAMFDDDPGLNGSPVIGFAADGFPIYGSYFVDDSGELRKAQSGYTLIEGDRPFSGSDPGGAYDGLYRADYEFTDSGDLDACNGMIVDGQYGYYVTESFPWIIGCFTGTPDPSFEK